MYAHTSALTGKILKTVFHIRSLPSMASELMTEELSVASVGINKLKTFDVCPVLMTFFTVLNSE